MQLRNNTGIHAQLTPGLRKDGHELLVVVAKGTYVLPPDGSNGADAIPHQDPVPILVTDQFAGEPGLSIPLAEADMCSGKPACDVVLNGFAYAPGGVPTPRFNAELRVGSVLTKRVAVVGSRTWTKGWLGGVKPSDPSPLVRAPVSYDVAFGGEDRSHSDEKKHAVFTENPLGIGFHSNLAREAVAGKPLPTTEDPSVPILRPDGEYHPMAFGPLARNWQPRVRYAGTYDQHWLDEVAPFLPDDFDERFHQCAPADQQMPYPAGGETIELIHLTPVGRLVFRIPQIDASILCFRTDRSEESGAAVIDTIVIEPELGRFTVTWRWSTVLRRSISEIDTVVFGPLSPAWLRARRLGKTYYEDVDKLILSRRLHAPEPEAVS